jgi:uncharacterized protein with von Willebrand factor type A (vWA) domain
MEGRILQLISALRASGVRVSLAESADAFSATDHMGVQERAIYRFSTSFSPFSSGAANRR